jgi:hypothetical protein
MADQFNILDQSLAYLETQGLTTGEATIPRHLVQSTSAATSTGNMRLTYFTARKSESITQVRMWCGGTAAAATPTLIRIGLYTVAANGDITLAASTDSDTALFAATNTSYTKALAAPLGKVAGQRYAVGLLVVTAGAAPTVYGHAIWGAATAEPAAAPRISGSVGSQSDLPASVVSASVAVNGQMHYAVLLP